VTSLGIAENKLNDASMGLFLTKALCDGGFRSNPRGARIGRSLSTSNLFRPSNLMMVDGFRYAH
jgi:hypothetical protein